MKKNQSAALFLSIPAQPVPRRAPRPPVRFLVAAGLALASALPAQTPAERLSRLALLGDFPAVSVRLTMRIERGGEAKERGLELFYRQAPGGVSDLLARVSAPAFLRNLKILRKQSAAGVELYLRNTQGVRRVVGDRGDEALFDSDFRTGDFLAAAGAAGVAGEDGANIVLSLAAPPGSAWASRRLTVRKADNFLLGFDELDAAGAALRRYEVLEFGTAAGRAYAKLSAMSVPAAGQRTLLEVTAIDPAPNLADSLFSRMGL